MTTAPGSLRGPSSCAGFLIPGSVDDLAAFVVADRRQPIAPRPERLGRLARPVGHLADDPERPRAAVGPGGVAGELLVGHVRVVLEGSRRLDGVHARSTVA